MEVLSHDNDDDTWQPLSLAAGRLLAKITEEKQEHTRSEENADRAEEEKREGERRDILYRLREIEAFERRVSGLDRPARKRRE